jgi:hypothetical protein
LGDWEQAVVGYEAALRQDPSLRGAHVRAADALCYLELAPEALSHYQEASALGDSSEHVRHSIEVILEAGHCPGGE